MDEVSRQEGRTVLFVSHNLEAVLRLCTRGVFFEAGSVRAIGNVKAIVSAYLNSQAASPTEVDLSSRARPHELTGKAHLVKAAPADASNGWLLPFGQQLSLDVTIDAEPSVAQIDLGLGIHSIRGFEVASWTNVINNVVLPVRPGTNTFRIRFDHLRLLPGRYSLGIGVRDGRGGEDYIDEAVLFEIVSSGKAGEIDAQTFGGAIVSDAIVSRLD
jgi:lipopolysaccharide transport system ATP-binding protein